MTELVWVIRLSIDSSYTTTSEEAAQQFTVIREKMKQETYTNVDLGNPTLQSQLFRSIAENNSVNLAYVSPRLRIDFLRIFRWILLRIREIYVKFEPRRCV
jgi:hypothetical protein